MPEEIRPCPHCDYPTNGVQRPAVQQSEPDLQGYITWRVSCGFCPSMSFGSTREEAIKNWNHRFIEDRLEQQLAEKDAEIERLRDTLRWLYLATVTDFPSKHVGEDQIKAATEKACDVLYGSNEQALGDNDENISKQIAFAGNAFSQELSEEMQELCDEVEVDAAFNPAFRGCYTCANCICGDRLCSKGHDDLMGKYMSRVADNQPGCPYWVEREKAVSDDSARVD